MRPSVEVHFSFLLLHEENWSHMSKKKFYGIIKKMFEETRRGWLVSCVGYDLNKFKRIKIKKNTAINNDFFLMI